MGTSTALVTGANKGIGFHTARLLGRRGVTVLLGARDATRGREAEARLRAEGVDAHTVVLDVTDTASVERAAGRVADGFGRLDVLVNNAGIASSTDPDRTTADELRRVFETNVIGLVAVTNAVLPCCARRRRPGSSTCRATSARSRGSAPGTVTPRRSRRWRTRCRRRR